MIRYPHASGAMARGEIRTGRGSVSGPVEFISGPREGARDPATVTVALTVSLSRLDVVALLWETIRDGGDWDRGLEPFETDPGYTHRIVCECLVAVAGTEIADARCAIVNGGHGAPPADIAERLFALVDRLYGDPAPQPARAARLHLVGAR